MSNVKTVSREVFKEVVESEPLTPNDVRGYTFSVMQYVDSEGRLRAQAVYRPGVTVYAVIEIDPAL